MTILLKNGFIAKFLIPNSTCHFIHLNLILVKKCNIYKVRIQAEVDSNVKKSLEADHELHLRKAQLARNFLQAARHVKKDEDENFTFDL